MPVYVYLGAQECASATIDAAHICTYVCKYVRTRIRIPIRMWRT